MIVSKKILKKNIYKFFDSEQEFNSKQEGIQEIL